MKFEFSRVEIIVYKLLRNFETYTDEWNFARLVKSISKHTCHYNSIFGTTETGVNQF